MSSLKGYRTYVIMGLTIALAVGQAITQFLSPEQTDSVLGIVGVLGVILRTITTTPPTKSS